MEELDHTLKTKDENRALYNQILALQDELQQLQRRGTAAANLIPELEFDPSAYTPLATLDKLIDTVTRKENQTNNLGKVLNLILKKQLDFKANTAGELTVEKLALNERDLRELLYCAESEKMIPPIPEDSSWKKAFDDHRKVFT